MTTTGERPVPYQHAFPPPQGLYDPRHEHDACGVAFVATLTGVASHDIVAKALTALRNLEHRGAAGAEPNSGDGAGILMQVPDAFLREVTAELGIELPPQHSYAVGTAFLPGDEEQVATQVARIEEIAAEEGLAVLGWRDVPTDPSILGATALGVMPTFRQLFVAGATQRVAGMQLERMAFCLRKRAERETDVYFPSLSSRTMAYKGMLTTDQLDHFFPDLVDERVASALAVVHSRFSTNTFPSWPLSPPFRFIAHNGEINTVMGNRNWMRAREALLSSDLIPGDLERLYPICTPGASDSASFDEVLELLHMGGRSLPHSVLMMIPEAWENHTEMDDARRSFYEFHASLMEPWDGPACVVFTDGDQIGAVLDRNGLRPGRFWITDDGLVVLASEVGVLDLDPAIARYEADEEVQDLLNASAGDNLGIDFLPGAFGYADGEAGTSQEATRVLWLDAFIANVDRSWRNPNLLVWHGDLWVIDHGASLYFHHAWPGGSLTREGAAQRFADQPWDPSDHVVDPAGVDLGATDAALRAALGAGVFAEVLDLVPDAWLEPVPGAETPAQVRAAYVDFLSARLASRAWLPGGAGV